jgi:hypothetical protein
MTTIPRYHRTAEQPASIETGALITLSELDDALAGSQLSPGSRDLIRGLLRTSRPAIFGGGGVGLEYGALLKTVARPDVLGGHVREVAAYLQERHVDLLFVPGMSGYPIGSMYSYASGIPALLLKKQAYDPESVNDLPPGSFVIPSYTGSIDTVISADLVAARDILAGLVDRQLVAQRNDARVTVTIHIGGADEIIDKATMATAITENAPIFVRSVIDELLNARAAEINNRSVDVSCRVVAWATPLIKSYNRANTILRDSFDINPLAGVSIIGIQIDPPAIGIAGLGWVCFGETA